MKCHKCGYNSFEFLERCKKCGSDLAEWKNRLGISSLLAPPERAPVPQYEEERAEAPPLPDPPLKPEPSPPSSPIDPFDITALTPSPSPSVDPPFPPSPLAAAAAAAPADPPAVIVGLGDFVIERGSQTEDEIWPERERFGRKEEPQESVPVLREEFANLEEVTRGQGNFVLTIDNELESLLQRPKRSGESLKVWEEE